MAKLHGFVVYAIKVDVGHVLHTIDGLWWMLFDTDAAAGPLKRLDFGVRAEHQTASRALGQLVGQLAHGIYCLDAETHSKILLL